VLAPVCCTVCFLCYFTFNIYLTTTAGVSLAVHISKKKS
jgi:hypothetical protein